jgi:hypothetical protein
MAESQVIGIAVVETIVIGQFLSSLDVPNGADHDFAIDFVRLAIWFTRMIDEGSDAVAIDHALPVA